MYKDSCCAQATMQSVNAFSRETLAASPSCQAGRNKVYKKKKKNFKTFFLSFFLCFFEWREDKDHTRKEKIFQDAHIATSWRYCSDVCFGHGTFSNITTGKPHNDNHLIAYSKDQIVCHQSYFYYWPKKRSNNKMLNQIWNEAMKPGGSLPYIVIKLA